MNLCLFDICRLVDMLMDMHLGISLSSALFFGVESVRNYEFEKVCAMAMGWLFLSTVNLRSRATWETGLWACPMGDSLDLDS